MTAFWESFRLDPRQPGNAPMRASDADREIVRGVLADAYADGRLTREEYDGRLGTLYGSRTLGDLTSLVADLVAPGSPPAASGSPPAAPARLADADLRARGARKWRKDVEEALGAFLVPSIICTVIWFLFSRSSFFWPLFPMLFLGLNLVSTVVRRETVIEREVLRLERRAAKQARRGALADSDEPREANGE